MAILAIVREGRCFVPDAADRLVAPRPVNSTFDLAKIEGTGLVIPDWQDRLRSRLIAD